MKLKIQKLDEEDGGGYFVTVPSLPGCMADGDTLEEAKTNIKIAIDMWIESERDFGHDIPVDKAETSFDSKI